MGEIIEHLDSGDASTVRVGESDSRMSIKVYQDVYHQLTGRTEQIRKRYSENLLLDLSELEQLHFKVIQLCDIHNIVASNEIVSIFHEKERKEQFTSFSRFKTYNSNATSPTINVVLKYNFSIIPAGLDRPQEYVITIKLSSRVAMLKQMEEEIPPFMRGRILGYLSGSSAEITVEYADYIIARGFLEAFNEWVRGAKVTPDNIWVSTIQKWSHLIPKTVNVIISMLIIYFALASVPMYFGSGSNSEQWARFSIIFFGGFYLIKSFSTVVSGIIENAIDSISPLSYLKLNKGDEILIDNFKQRRNFIKFKLILGGVVTIILGVASSKLASLI
ncbi:hypothetical protein [Yersinia enterocolitica]|uniref:hypothetical protein n=1 Tax=Yersinia enterocolitica TaxID=630 RepID=UPI0005DAB173|nr:hypothetical protein [Yersinia enterocolitica]EKN3682144.1 hypothetical protein [Yersinia enterocolitica]EKN4188719.1 hypothetical protein [Yersinia enterocolitica]EKN4192299.1 hypothetical protein [Yersinia enterocolitica]ELI7903887.1 hypothetical protein [Yersinia enterocolitica]ELI7907520.1 hypothetical protein [Yersinia enterocolitica]